MIAVASAEGRLLKVLSNENGEYGLHRVFGFILKDSLQGRIDRRKNSGISTAAKDSWLCRFNLNSSDGKIDIRATEGCQIQKVSDQRWSMQTAQGEFSFQTVDQVASPLVSPSVDEAPLSTQKKALLLIGLMILVALPTVLSRFFHSEEVVAPVVVEPITVKIVQEVQKAVKVPDTLTVEESKIKIQDKQVKRAIQQNLGFLGLLGNKNLTKAIGGVPTQIKDASAGAGAGTAGSGGELLVGLGQGVKQTTVGNTGVTGLGGVGTKGAGGGAGGYGNSMIGSGEGKSLSRVALSQDMILEGGLDRAVIQATIAKYLSQVRACYEEGLRGNPGLTGQVNMNFSISGMGDVSSAQVQKSSLGNAAVEGCIATKMLNWKFPKPVGGVSVKVNYPFLLRPIGA